jgi:transglutaminase-like putative cysteine protease
MPQELIDELLPILDYAVVNGCSRFCFPASTVTYTMIRQASRYLSYSYDINDKCRINPLTVQRVALGDAEVNFLMITVLGMECSGSVDKYREGLAAAQAVVDAMPEGLDEQGKMLYLYKYLCDNVRYSYGLYYESNDVSLLYDALVLHSTVCAGYAEGLFVLCNLAGLDCFILSGEVGPLGDINDLHAWNIARVDGKYYEFDATWDEGKPPERYVWYGMSEDYARISHAKLRSFEAEILPPHPDKLKLVLSPDLEGVDYGG